MNPAIELTQLSKRFGRQTALKDVSLSVPTGSIFGYLGPNGAGKTTTIKILMNIISASGGKAAIQGCDARKLGPKHLRQIGYVSENQALPEALTPAGLFRLCRPLYPGWDAAFCNTLTKRFDLPLNKKIRSLSRGMRMKAALIASLAFRPKLLVLDEPFSGLDPAVRQDLIDGILELTENEDWTIFISSHDVDEIERLADWIGFLDKGELKLREETASLQNRFRRVVVSLPAKPQLGAHLPKTWQDIEQGDQAISFIETDFQQEECEKLLRMIFPQATHWAATPMSLRDIFITLAKQYKVLNL